MASTDEHEQDEMLQKQIEGMLEDAENYLAYAKSKKDKHIQNFEAMLAFEYAVKARDRSAKFRHEKEAFYDSVKRRADSILEEVKKLPVTFRQKKHEEDDYEAGDVAGG